jgi:hypothetical protein
MNNNNQHINLKDIEIHENTLPKPNVIEIEKVPNNTREGMKVNRENNNESIDQSNSQHDQEKFSIPSNLKRTFICSVILFVVGTTLIIIGFINQVREADPGNGITFWVLGSVVLIPGAYYSYQFYKARKNINNRRDDILSQIPEL